MGVFELFNGRIHLSLRESRAFYRFKDFPLNWPANNIVLDKNVMISTGYV